MTKTLFVAACVIAGCGEMAWNRDSEMATDPQRARMDARTVLLQSVHSSDPLIRTHAVEAIGRTLGDQEGRILLQGLADPAVSVQYAAAMAAGDIAYRPAGPRLVEIVKDPHSDQRVVSAAIYALHRMGSDAYTGQLAVLLHSEFDEGRAAAAAVMGKMGEPSAIGPLRSMLVDEKTPAVRLAIVESLTRLGDSASAQMLESYAKQYFLDLRLAVIPTIGELHVPGAQRILRQLLRNAKNPPRVRVAAAGAMGTLGMYANDGYQMAQSALENPDALLREFYGDKHAVSDVERSSLQQLAALALGKMGNQKALAVLHPFLQEDDPAVRVAAAMAVLQLLSPQQPLTPVADEPAPTPAPDETPSPARRLPRIQSSGGMDELEEK
ncbi:MAG: HEAT repeat domain-containing protein [Phycisphaerae bacterium]|nr:HEAT repeat domain-containing protein [Phycisphaerae bacterium]